MKEHMHPSGSRPEGHHFSKARRYVMRRHHLPTPETAGIVVVIALLLLFFLTSCGTKETTIHAEQKTLTAAVYASGTLVPEQEYKVVSTVDGYLVDAQVKEGDTVRQGQMLFRVSSEVRNAQRQGAGELVSRTVPAASAHAPVLREIEGRMEVARLRMQQDSLQYARYQSLYDQQAISKSAYERYYLQYQASLKDYSSLRQQWQQQKLSAGIQLQQAENQLLVAAAQSNVGNLKSFVNGVIYDVYKEEGDLVMPNQPIALIGAGGMIARLLVDEDDLEKVYAGQQVLITMDAYPEKVFRAHISKVYPFLNKVEQSFRVDAVLDEPVPAGVYGLNLEANIVVAENKPVLAIPKAALLKGDSVLVKEGKKQRKVKIIKGIEDAEWVEVRSGLTPSTAIILEP